MKIRSGFVSNSSSSSFLIYGTPIEYEDIKKLVNEFCKPELEKIAEECAMDIEDIDSYEISEILEGYLYKQGVGLHRAYEDSYYIGNSWCSIDDDETGKQFKERINNKVKELLGKNYKCSSISEAWHD